MPRAEVATYGSYVSVPDAFDSASDNVRNAIKMELSTSRSTSPSGSPFVDSFATDRLMLDFDAIEPAAISLDQVVGDCELVMALVREHPDELRELLYAVAGEDGGDIAKILHAAETLKRVGFTEEVAVKSGGGLFGILILVGAALFASGCTGVTAHGRAGKKPPKAPTPPHDAGAPD